MGEQPAPDEETVLRMVQAWSRDQRVHLAYRLLDPGIGTLDPQTGRPYVASAQLRGIGAGNRPAPSGESPRTLR